MQGLNLGTSADRLFFPGSAADCPDSPRSARTTDRGGRYASTGGGGWRAALVLSLLGALGHVQAADLNVEIQGIDSIEGSIKVAVFNTAADFTQKPLSTRSVRAAKGSVRLVFSDLATGRYALSAYHDLNDNGKLDRGLFGIPKEPYGFSRDARSNSGPPEFRDAAFALGDAATPVVVTLR